MINNAWQLYHVITQFSGPLKLQLGMNIVNITHSELFLKSKNIAKKEQGLTLLSQNSWEMDQIFL